MNAQELVATAKAMVAEGKGLLATDESTPTCNKRFEKVGIPQTEETRRSYRELIVTTPGLGEFISGVILYDKNSVGPDFLFLPSDPATRAGNMEGPAGKCSRGAAGSVSSSQVQQCRTPWPVQDRDGK